MSAFVQRIRTAAWLGWQIESNWADAIVFGVYTLIRPIGTALILGGMFWAVGATARRPALFAALYVANAVHEYVTRAVVGMGWVIVEEREQYETLKLVYASPIGMRTYLWGRASIKFALASFTVVIVLVLGWFLFRVRWEWSAVQWLPLAASFALVLVATLFLGFLVAGFALVLPRIAMSMNEGIAIALYMLCGVIFPIDLMPHGLRELSLALPFTYGYEAIRRFLLGHGASAVLGRMSDLELLGMLAVTTLAMSAIAHYGYTALENRARREGRLDQTTMF
ncbi:MAG: hypothetical protein DMD82_10650 [Candidatus Rokuibacteriota bacterium]|nr:MAG: hypothetical protein DMD82_10650 [Candidatus Rokubacteria bacterium]